ncbi:hypothetical protein Q8F55_007733 [Vanrija albida]|uniref:RRM domain-containing protein n=1 Tax=Vanrija albida TaxID=181172 RepID=A0ABR3PUB9_9TREE
MSKRLDLSQFRDDSSDDESDLSISKGPKLDTLKSKTFSYGVTKKTKKDLEREAEEKKRREEEEATKRALEEFSQVFEGKANEGPSFGGRHRAHGRSFVRAGEAPSSGPPLHHETASKFRPSAFSEEAPTPSAPPKPRGKRAMDSFLDEIKRNQEARDATLGKSGNRDGSSVSALAAHGGTAYGGLSDSDSSTNLFIVNLPTTLSEDSLGRLFAAIGPVGTVKIMWPRGEDLRGHPATRRVKPGLTGFVCYMGRSDAERAVREFDGYEWNGSVLRVSWSKPVPIPRKALYDESYRSSEPFSRPGNAPESVGSKRRRSESPRPDSNEHQSFWLDQVDPKDLDFIKAVVERIKTHGSDFKDMLLERERNNPRFVFMFDQEAASHFVFQSLLDPNYTFPQPPVAQFDDEGYASIYSSDSAEEGERVRAAKRSLGPLGRKRFEALLRAMSGKRVEIARTMEFAMKRAEAADEVADIVCQSLEIEETPIPRKVARLHLVSDILHNSASPMPNVWRYRQVFESRLPTTFAHFATVHQRLLDLVGTVAANVFEQQVDAVLSIWEGWMVFTADFHRTLRELLHGQITLESLSSSAAPEPEPEQESENQPKSAGFKSSFKRITSVPAPAQVEDVSSQLNTAPQSDLDGDAMDDVDGEEMLDGEDIDGEDGGIDGEDIDGEEVDGEPIAADDLDGEAIDP